MARPTKSGLDYFPIDTDLDNDPDVQVLQAEFGNDGYAVLIKMWARAYKSPDGEVDFSTDVRLKLLAKQCNVSVKLWVKIIQLCVELGLFSSQDYTKKRLTSGGIKKRIQKILDERQRGKEKGAKPKPNEINTNAELSPGITLEKPRNNSGITPEIAGVSPPERESKSKRESKIQSESSKENGAKAPAPKKPEFIKPSAGEVIEHFRSKGYHDPNREGQKFWNYYEQIGWRVGKKQIPMSNWHLAASNWSIKNEQDRQGFLKANEINNKYRTSGRNLDESDLERIRRANGVGIRDSAS